VEGLLADLERAGPEEVGAPLRAVALLACDAGQLHGGGDDALARRRRRAAAARLARRALSLAGGIEGARGTRPDRARAYEQAVRDLDPRSSSDIAEALGRVAGMALLLPQAPDGDDWEAAFLAFADEDLLTDLREACVELASAALVAAD
jgi:hypothetical protein